MKEKWYEKTVFYEIYVPSFCDGNGDGIGDLRGAASKIPYLKNLGVSGVWLTPFYPSPKVDNGYDVSDYRDVDKDFGTLEDFDFFLRTAHEHGIRVIIDMVLNHTSTAHKWFLESRKSGDNPYGDYYIWKKEIENNWQSFFDAGAWEYDEQRGMYYYHAFAREMACLNWSNPVVRQECLDILTFWLEREVDGFRLDVINFLKTDPEAFGKDNPKEKGEIQHLYDKNQKGIYKALEEISALVHSYPDKYLLGEVGEEDLNLIHSYVGEKWLDSAFYFNLGSMEKLDVSYMADEMKKMEERGIYPTLFFSSHDMSRHFNRLCEKKESLAKLLAVFLLSAKGIPFLYQGEEMAAEDVVINRPEDLKDIQGRYGYEKMLSQGADKEEAFAYAKKRARDYSRGMLDWEQEEKPGLWEVYREMLLVRKQHPALLKGEYAKVRQQGQRLYYCRESGKDRVEVYLHFDLTALDTALLERQILEVRDEQNRVIGLLRYSE